jgi:aminoglycoside phosphotransferase (APT) family kinase protein
LVFRFPRREVAVPLLRTEVAILPRLEGRLPLAVPTVRHVAEPGERFPWPYIGLGWLAGRTGEQCALDDSQRGDWAVALGGFLAMLHGMPPSLAADVDVPRDQLRRLDVAWRAEQALPRLEAAERAGLLDDVGIIEGTPTDLEPRSDVLVHGDLYARNLLADESGRPEGVIDWGDCHLGDPAMDLAVAHSLLPASARDAFRKEYGVIDAATWQLARFRALIHGLAVLLYAADIDDGPLLAEARRALDNISQEC